MNIGELSKRALEIREKYTNFEKENSKEWGNLQVMEGFVGDIGDLMKLVMAKEGYRKIENVDEKLKHELADCFYSILILASKYKINLEEEFLKTMDKIERNIN